MVMQLERGAPAETTRRDIRVAIVDRRRLIADALASLVAESERLSVVGVIAGEVSAVTIADCRPELVMLGVSSDPAEVRPLLDALRSRAPRTQVVLLADELTPALVGCVLQRGLGGLLLTSCPAEDLVSSLVHVSRGQAVLPSGWQAKAQRGDSPLDALSDRQLDVLRLLAEGCSYEEIGVRLFISVNTVKFHMRSIFERLGVRNRISAVRLLTDSTRPAR